jgi:PIN domain nuclease of toxin-antitoxin system
LLLDTHLVLWSQDEFERLSEAARTILDNGDNELVYSVVTLWETAIQRALGRSDFGFDARELRRVLLREGWQELPVSGEHTLAVGELPPIHKDPFDRLLTAQAAV